MPGLNSQSGNVWEYGMRTRGVRPGTRVTASHHRAPQCFAKRVPASMLPEISMFSGVVRLYRQENGQESTQTVAPMRRQLPIPDVVGGQAQTAHLVVETFAGDSEGLIGGLHCAVVSGQFGHDDRTFESVEPIAEMAAGC